MKQKAAAFLAVCMTVGSLPAGSAAAVPAETNGTPEDSNVAEIIEFDPVKLKDAMDQAVKNDEMVTPPTVVASSSDITGFSSAVFELKDAEKLLVTGSDMPDNTDVRIFLAPESEGYGEDGEYSLTGNESMIFMVENQGGEDQGYQLLFGNRITDVIEVKSKDRLLAEYYNPEDLDKATDSDAATPSESEAFETESGEDPTATGSETVAAAERSLFDRLTGTMVAYGAELKATASESGEFGENGRDEAEVPSAPAEENTEDEKEPSLPQETVPETEASQESVPETEETQESRPEAEAPAETAPETETEAAEEEEMNHFTAYDTAVDENGYVRLSSGEISSSLLVVKNSFDKVDAEEGMDEPMAIRFAATKRMAKMVNEGNGIALMSMDDEAETVADSKLTAAAFFVTTAANVLANGDDGESPFTVNLYDYAGTSGGASGSALNELNSYLNEKRYDFRFGQNQSGNCNSYTGSSGRPSNVRQGIVAEQNKKGGDILKDIFTDEDVTQGSGWNRKNIISLEKNVDVSNFFTYNEETWTYEYNSNDKYAKYDEDDNALVSDDHTVSGDRKRTGFWPFTDEENVRWDSGNQYWTADNCYFGMTVAFDFFRPADGKINGDPMTFNFSGDDDVWVYLTDTDNNTTKLVLDLGGIHGAMDGSINFATGEVTYSNENALERERYYNDGWGYKANPVIYGETCDTAGNGNGTYSTYTDESLKEFLTSGTNYKLEFYYLERGAGASNCMLKFNLPTVPKKGITLAKSLNGSKVTDNERSATYSFNVVSSDDKDELLNYRSSGGDDSSVKIQQVHITGAGMTSVPEAVDQENYFYIEEINPGTNTVEWNVNRNPVDSTEAGFRTEGTKKYYYSPVYQMPSDEEDSTGFLVICENWFGKLQPTVGKTAILREGEDGGNGIYNITLSVTGDTGIETTTTTKDAIVDMVVVLDPSGSMETGTYEEKDEWGQTHKVTYAKGAKEAILDLAESLAEKSNGQSRMKIVAFGGSSKTNDIRQYVPYYDENGSGQYYKIVTPEWITLGENALGQDGSLSEALNQIRFNLSTHSASGFLGAKDALADADEDHQKVVVYITDGDPNSFVKKVNVGEWWSDYYKTIYFGQPDDYILEYYDLNPDKIRDYGIEAARVTLSMLKDKYPDVPVYTISYGTYANSANSNDDWLKPKGSGKGQSWNGSDGITKYFAAKDADDLKEAFDEIQESTEVEVKVQNLVVTDELSEHAVIYNGVTKGNLTGPRLKLGDTELEVRNVNNVLQYYLSGNPDKVIAEFVQPTNGNNGTITWYVADQLGEENTETLSFPVKASGDYYEDASQYPDIPESGTGTHSTQNPSKGYYSNGKAELEYGPEGEREEMDFPKPVIRPVQQYAELNLSKEIEGDYAEGEDWSFDFYIGLDKPMKDAENLVINSNIPNQLEDYEYVYKVTLSRNDAERTFSVPIGAQCQVLESDEELAAHYKVTGTEFKVNNSAGEGVLTNVQEISSNGLDIRYTNTISQYSKITIHKDVVDNTHTMDPNTPFTFEVEMKGKDGWKIYGNNDNVQIKDGGFTEVWIDPDDARNEFRITETNTQRAWKTTYKIGKSGTETPDTSVVIDDLEKVQDIYFTNYYYDHSITVEKKVDGEELIQNAEYPFEVKFTVKDGEELLKKGVNATVVKADGTSLGKLPVSDENYRDNTLSFKLKAGEKLIISNLPQSVTGYEVKEKLKEFNEDIKDDSYEVDLKKITVNGYPQKDVGECTVTKDLAAGGDQNDEIVYTNQYKYLYGELTINKMISKEAPKEDTVFTFKVTDSNGKVFYATVKVDKGTHAGKTTLENIPAGTYTVEEIDSNARYELAETQNPQTVAVPAGNEGEVTFTNKKTTDGYFSDVSTVVNTVDKGKFTADPAPKPLPNSSPQLALQMNAGAFLLPGEIRMQPNDGDEMIQPA